MRLDESDDVSEDVSDDLKNDVSDYLRAEESSDDERANVSQ